MTAPIWMKTLEKCRTSDQKSPTTICLRNAAAPCRKALPNQADMQWLVEMRCYQQTRLLSNHSDHMDVAATSKAGYCWCGSC
mmetsp:Transcript_14169/g.42757  ORF Transcript_14169/g.42757 Transcript_14169/m.42757 type:complete len:82 (+) Transcript_14169:1978-2223(+)